jgi:HSP20 family protein
MRSGPADMALRNLRRLVERDPILRDIVEPVLPPVRSHSRFVPPTDVVELEDRYVIVMEVPGIPREALRVHLDGSRLTVSGDKPPSSAGRPRMGERESGPFSREFLIPFQILAERISAKLDQGLLTITLPRSGSGRSHDVPIE